MNIFKRIFRPICCRIGIHNWETIKSIKVLYLILRIKSHTPILAKIAMTDVDLNLLVLDRKCRECGIEDLEIEVTKQVLIDKMMNKLKL